MPDLGLARDASHVTHFRSGDHLCLFYRNLDEQIATLGPFVHLGLRQNERCVCIQTLEARQALSGWLNAHGVDTAHEIGRGALVFADPSATYRDGNKFADIVGSPEQPGIYSFRIQRDGSGELLSYGQEQSLSTAIFQCQRLLSRASA